MRLRIDRFQQASQARSASRPPPHNMYQARSIMDQCCNTVAFSGGYQERPCEIMRVQIGVCCYFLMGKDPEGGKKQQKRGNFQHSILLPPPPPPTFQFRCYTNVFVDNLLLEIFSLNLDAGSFQQDNHANAGYSQNEST